MTTTASSTVFAWGYGIRSNKKAAERSAAFYLPGGACAYPAYGLTVLLFFRTAHSTFTIVLGQVTFTDTN